MDDGRLHRARRSRDQRAQGPFGGRARPEPEAVLEVRLRVDPGEQRAVGRNELRDRCERLAGRERVVEDAVAVDEVELATRKRKREERRDDGVNERFAVDRGAAVEQRQVQVGAERLHARDTVQEQRLRSVPAADVRAAIPPLSARLAARSSSIRMKSSRSRCVYVNVSSSSRTVSHSVLKLDCVIRSPGLGSPAGGAYPVSAPACSDANSAWSSVSKSRRIGHVTHDRVPDAASRAEQRPRRDKPLVAHRFERLQLQLSRADRASKAIDKSELHAAPNARS